MKGFLLKFVVLASVLILVVACSNSHSISSKGKNGEDTTSVSTNNKAQDNKKGEETVRTYLENEFTGPNEELNHIFMKKDFQEQVTALNKYIDKKYKDIIAENKYQAYINANQILRWLKPANHRGYQLKPKNIDIQKVDNYNAYTFKVEVEYSKAGKTNTTTVTGYINLNSNGKISEIRDVKDKELIQIMMPPPPKENK